MKGFLLNFEPLWQSFILSTIFTYGFTALGAGLIFFIRRPTNFLYSFMLAFAAGLMFSASVFSLLTPAFRYFHDSDSKFWANLLTLSFSSGALVFYIFDTSWNLIRKSRMGIKMNFSVHKEHKESEREKSSIRRAFLLVGAITLHNVPEGMAVGVAIADSINQGFIISLGVGFHNLVEGFAVSVPLLAAGISPLLSFLLGQMSGIVCPLSSVISTQITLSHSEFLPHMLAFAASCMIFVAVEDLLPNAYQNQGKLSISIPFFIGFILMMWFENILV